MQETIEIDGKQALSISDAQIYMGFESRAGLMKMLKRNKTNVWKPKTGGKTRYVLLQDLDALKVFEIDVDYTYSPEEE